MTTKNETIETVEEETVERGIIYNFAVGVIGIIMFLVLLKIVGFILVGGFWAIIALMA